MTPVYVTSTQGFFHLSLDCSRLGVARSFTVIDINEVGRRTVCGSCAPGSKVKFVKRFCPQCNTRYARACAHNGGVLVEQIVTTTYYSAMREPGDTLIRRAYVWPHRAHLYAKA